MQSFVGSMQTSISTFFQTHSLEMILIISLSIICLIILVLLMQLQRRINRLLRGKNPVTFEDSIKNISKELDELLKFRKDSEEYLAFVEKRLRNSVQSIDTLRFNAFKGTGAGGNQSFASAFINEHGDGVIISTLYSSDRMSIFAKPIAKFKPQFDLTDEEAHVLENATKKLTH